jgi:uncharacterized protein (TIGR02145 family)
MKKTFLFAGLAILVLAACNKTPQSDKTPVDFSRYALRVEPVITRATETDFENGDAIGLTVTRAGGAYAANEKLTYDGTAFTGSLNWYAEGSDEATLKAYYPYASAVPATFTVAADQSAGTASSDFLSAVKEGVLPTANAVAMVFKHRLSRLAVTLKNNSGSPIESVVFKGAIPTAVIADDLTATVDASAEPMDIKAFADGEKYYAILPAQKATLTAAVTAGGKELTQELAEATLESGKQYSVSIIVNKEEIKVVLAGDIENWNEGGEITGGGEGGPAFEEKLDEGYFTYDGVKYNVVKMKDGKWWMAQNLAYLPEGYTPATDLSAVTAGIFAPLQVNAGKTAAEFATDAAAVAANGYLYQAEVALGLKVGDLTSVEAAEALEGAQGICPKGWHLPALTEIIALVGKSIGATAVETAPYYDNGNGSIVKLNEDGFNMAPFGAVTIQDNTKTTGSFMGFMPAYPDRLSSGMFCGSTYAGVTYNTSGDAASGVKNLQFYGFMPMTNKATEAEYTCNGAKVSYRIAAPVRCVRN